MKLTTQEFNHEAGCDGTIACDQVLADRVVVGRYLFHGPYVNLDRVTDEPGLLAVFRQVNDNLSLIEVIETDCIKNAARFVSHDLPSVLSVAVLYTRQMTQLERVALRDEVLYQLANEAVA